jgi:hypothetical protein
VSIDVILRSENVRHTVCVLLPEAAQATNLLQIQPFENSLDKLQALEHMTVTAYLQTASKPNI